MAKGTKHNWERRFFNDKETGLRITQLTSYPTINQKLYFHDSAFTPDSKSFIFLSQTVPTRGGDYDLYKVDIDGTNLTQLTEGAGIYGVQMAPDGKKIYFMRGNSLFQMDIDTLKEELIIEAKDILRGGGGTISPDCKYYATCGRTKDDKPVLVRIATDGSEVKIIYEYIHPIGHEQYEPSNSGTILFNSWKDEKQLSLWLIEDDGSNPRILNLPKSTGHFMWIGKTKRILSTIHPEGDIETIADGEEKPTTIASGLGIEGGLYFWHAGVSSDGKWAVSDTNWPNVGLKLVNLETGKHKTLCLTESSSGHSGWTHPHPSFSPDGKIVVFNSDRTGVPHIYLVAIPDEFL